VGTDVGRIEGHVLTVESGNDGGARWAVEPGDALPKDFAPRLLTRQAYDALREGEVLQEGTLTWQGRRWALRDTWDGAKLLAALDPL
jgi:hypothetical protein